MALKHRQQRTLALGFQCVDFCINTSFSTPGGTKSFNMVDIGDKSEVNKDNYIPVDESKLKEDQQKEYLELVERFKRECCDNLGSRN